jgi:hypothetical protein
MNISIYDRIRAEKGDVLHPGTIAKATKPADGKIPSVYDLVRQNFDPTKSPSTGTTN